MIIKNYPPYFNKKITYFLYNLKYFLKEELFLPESDFDKLFADFKTVLDELEVKKLRGINDYNVYEILKTYDETTLHSGFIYSFLNPNGTHYQKSLFLKKFLEICQIDDFNYENAEVFKEYSLKNGRLDIFITDGNKHIILENKICAVEQKNQIERYIEDIKKDKNCEYNDILVLYLSLDAKFPDKYSLGNFEIKDNFLVKDDKKVKIIAISYKLEITQWIKECKKEIINLTNLNFAISEYENVIKKLYGEYEMAEANVVKVIKENYETAKTIYEKFLEVEKEIVNDFLQEVYKVINNKLGNEFDIEFTPFTKKYERNLKIKKNNWRLYFSSEIILDRSIYYLYYGIARDDDDNIDCKNIEFSGKNKNGFENTKWWIVWKWLGKNDNGQDENLAENILNGAITPEFFVNIIVNFVNEYKKELEEINQDLK